MGWTSAPQYVEQMSEVLHTLRLHLENVLEDELLHGGGVNTATTATKFDAVEDNVVVRCYRGRRICE